MFRRIMLVLALALLVIIGVGVYFINQAAELTGVVRDASTHEPIAGAQVHVANVIAVTTSEGRYRANVPRGVYTTTISADGFAALSATVNGDDLLAYTFAIDFLLEPNMVTVTLRDAETRQPLSNVSVKVGNQTITSNAQGVVNARGVKTGASFTAQLVGYEPIAVAYDGQGNFEIPITPNRVAVRVVNKYVNQPVPNAQVQIPGQVLTTDAQGRVILQRVKPATTIQVSAKGFDNAVGSFTLGDVQIELRPNTLDGIVTDATTNQPISGTLVYFGNTIVPTNGKGEYHLENVPAKANLTFKIPGYRRTQIDASGVMRRDVKLAPFQVKGIHIPFGIPPERVRELMDLVTKTELNAIVIDVKAERGRIAWDSQVELAKAINAVSLHGISMTEVINWCKTNNIYCIARLPVFQDNLLASSRPNLAVKSTNGIVFTEGGGQQWVNPYLVDNWNYAIALAKEIVALGFDEIQFDYVRFPGIVNNGIDWGTENNEEKRIAAITGFLARAQKELRPTGVFISADVFGLTTATNDDQHTGQRLRDLGPYLDYVSPMVYPDTWVEASYLLSRGLGIVNCTEAVRCPYDVIYNSYKRAAEKTTTKVRLWLQAYSGRGDFGVTQYRVQKKAAVDAGSEGWMFWNGQGNYDPKIFDAK